MRRAITIVGLILAVGVLAPAGAFAKAGGTDRPIKDHSSGTNVVDLSDLSFAIDAKGIGSHLGRTTSHFEGVVTPTGPGSIAINGTATVIAANGDELYGTLSGSGVDDGAGGTEGQVAVTFTGGTGRFQDASGSYSGPFSQTLLSVNGTTATFAIEYSLKGTISR